MKKIGKRRGQGLVEYGLVITLIALVCIGILTSIGQTVNDPYEKTQVELKQIETNVTK